MTKKKQSGQHSTPRKSVQFEVDWLTLARRLAAKRKQPVVWFITSLIAEAAEKEGEPLPPYPWDRQAGQP